MLKNFLRFGFLMVCVLLVAGCGSVRHASDFRTDLAAEIKAQVGKVTNDTGKSFNIDIEQMFADALDSRLRKYKLLGAGASGKTAVVNAKIIDYAKGNAFKRWLCPGFGTTVLSVYCEVRDKASGKLLGAIEARRTVSMGGLYSINAWKSIFYGVAADVAKEFRKNIAR